MNDIMLDMESLSLQHNAAILSIGAVLFDPLGNDTPETIAAGTQPWSKVGNAPRTFYCVVSLEKQVEKYGRHIDAGTIEWWMRQDKAARDALFADNIDRTELSVALMQLSAWAGFVGGKMLWSHGAATDAVWLESAYRGINVRCPFHYRDVRCVRTTVALHENEPLEVPGLVEHNALDDAIYQVLRVQNALRHTTKERIAA